MTYVKNTMEGIEKITDKEYGDLKRQYLDNERELKVQERQIEEYKKMQYLKQNALAKYEEIIRRELKVQPHYECDICQGKLFMSVKALEGHYKRRHPEIGVPPKKVEKKEVEINLNLEAAEKDRKQVEDLAEKCEKTLNNVIEKIAKEPAEYQPIEKVREIPKFEIENLDPVTIEYEEKKLQNVEVITPTKEEIKSPKSQVIEIHEIVNIVPNTPIAVNDTQKEESIHVSEHKLSPIKEEIHRNIEIVYQPKLEGKKMMPPVISEEQTNVISNSMQTLYCLYDPNLCEIYKGDITKKDLKDEIISARGTIIVSNSTQTRETSVNVIIKRKPFAIIGNKAKQMHNAIPKLKKQEIKYIEEEKVDENSKKPPKLTRKLTGSEDENNKMSIECLRLQSARSV